MKTGKWGLLIFLAGLWLFSLPSAQAISGGDGSVSLVDGSYNYRYDFELPPGRNGISPDLALLYSSKAGRSHLGEGWRLNIPFIIRSTRQGAPSYLEEEPTDPNSPLRADVFEFHDAQGAVHLLVPVEKDGDAIWYRALREGLFIWFKYHKQSRAWLALLPNGHRMEFGVSGSRDGILSWNKDQKRAAWYLTRYLDNASNAVEYTYMRSEDTSTGQVRWPMPSSISYTRNLNHDWKPWVIVNFHYEAPDNSSFQFYTCELGRCIYQQNGWLKAIGVFVRDEGDTEKYSKVKEVELEFADQDGHRELQKIKQTAWSLQDKQAAAVSLPEVSFRYEPTEVVWPSGAETELSDFTTSRPMEISIPDHDTKEFDPNYGPEFVQTTERASLADLNGDGIRDLIWTEGLNKLMVRFGTSVHDENGSRMSFGPPTPIGFVGAAGEQDTAVNLLRMSMGTHIELINRMLGERVASYMDDRKCDKYLELFGYTNGTAVLVCKNRDLSTWVSLGLMYHHYKIESLRLLKKVLLDFNGDGYPDWVSFDESNRKFVVGLNDGTGARFVVNTYSTPATLDGFLLGSYRRQIDRYQDPRDWWLNTVEDSELSLIDLNGDGQVDIVDQRGYDESSNSYFKVYFQRDGRFLRIAHPWYSPVRTLQRTTSFEANLSMGECLKRSLTQMQDCEHHNRSERDPLLVDMNADSYPDLIYCYQYKITNEDMRWSPFFEKEVDNDNRMNLNRRCLAWAVAYNTGWGFDGFSLIFTPEEGMFAAIDHQNGYGTYDNSIYTQSSGSSAPPKKVNLNHKNSQWSQLTDCNQDGLPDLLTNTDKGSYVCMANSGIGLRKSSIEFKGTYFKPRVWFEATNSKDPNTHTYDATWLVDVDGDGVNDKVTDNWKSFRIQQSAHKPIRKLRWVTSGDQYQIEIKYGYNGQSFGTKTVVKSVETRDLITADSHLMEYDFAGGTRLVSMPKGLLDGPTGFARATVTDRARSIQKIVEHATDRSIWVGLPLTVEEKDLSGSIPRTIRKIVNTYQEALAIGPNQPLLSIAPQAIRYAVLGSTSTTEIGEDGKELTLRSSFAYDDIGQLKYASSEEFSLGREKNTHREDCRIPNVLEKETIIDYKRVDRHREGVFVSAKKSVLTRYNTGKPSEDATVGKTEFYHDGAENLDQISQGLLTKVRSYASMEKYYDTRYVYDVQAGLPSTVIDPYGTATDVVMDNWTHSYPHEVTTGGLKRTYKRSLAHGQQTAQTDPNGETWESQYDGWGRLLRSYLPGGILKEQIDYITSPTYAQVTSIQDSSTGSKRQIRMYFDGTGKPIELHELTDDQGQVRCTSVDYDAMGRRTRISAPFYTGWELAQPSGQMSKAGSQEALRALVDKYWKDTVFDAIAYDGQDRPVTETRAYQSRSRSFLYPSALTQVSIDEMGNRVEVRIDPKGNPVKVIRGSGPEASTARYSYDVQGRLVAADTALDGTSFGWVRYQRDWLGRIETVGVNPQMQKCPTAVDLGPVIVDPHTQHVLHPFDPIVNPGSTVINPPGVRSALLAIDRVRSVNVLVDSYLAMMSVPRSHEVVRIDTLWQMIYDENKEHSLRLISPDGREVKWIYDGLGRLSKRTSIVDKAEQETQSYTYDEETSGDGQPRYGKGRLTSARSGHHATEYLYDALGRVREQTTTLRDSGNRYAMRFGYNEGSALTWVEYPGGERYDYSYWADGAPKGLTRTADNKRIANVEAYNFDVQGQLRFFESDFIKYSFDYYPDGLLKTILSTAKNPSFRADGSSQIFQRGLSYQPNAQLQSVVDAIGGAESRYIYEYDSLMRLWKEQRPDGTRVYEYDPGSRLKRRTLNAEVEEYKYENPNLPWAATRVQQSSGAGDLQTWQNGEGQVIGLQQGTEVDRLLSFDVLGQLKTLVGDGKTEQFVYDHLDQRLVTVRSGSDSRVIEHLGHWFEYDTATKTSRNYLYFAGALLAYEEKGAGTQICKLFYLHSDQASNVHVITDEQGREQMRQEFDVFGAMMGNNGQNTYERGFSGAWQLGSGSLHQFPSRTYSSKLRQWMSMDPLVLFEPKINIWDGVNPYAFVRQDPVNRIDPLGTSSRCTSSNCLESRYDIDDGRGTVTIVIDDFFGPNPAYSVSSEGTSKLQFESHNYEADTAPKPANEDRGIISSLERVFESAPGFATGQTGLEESLQLRETLRNEYQAAWQNGEFGRVFTNALKGGLTEFDVFFWSAYQGAVTGISLVPGAIFWGLEAAGVSPTTIDGAIYSTMSMPPAVAAFGAMAKYSRLLAVAKLGALSRWVKGFTWVASNRVGPVAISMLRRLAQGEEIGAVFRVKDVILRPYGGPGGGHHVPAKGAFFGAAGYDAKAALAIPNEELTRLGISHSAVSGAQMTGYRVFAQTGAPLTWEALSIIETNALIRGGMVPEMAITTVKRAINALKKAGVSGPTRIPWGQ